MPKTHYPFRLHKFTSTTGDPKNIQKGLRDLLDFIVSKEQEVIDNAFTTAVEKATQAPELLKGSVNRAGVKLGLNPAFTEKEKAAQKHLYNFSEMVRANLTSLVGSYVQRSYLFDVIANIPDAEPVEIAKAYKELTGKNVSRVQIDKLLRALANDLPVPSRPSPASEGRSGKGTLLQASSSFLFLIFLYGVPSKCLGGTPVLVLDDWKALFQKVCLRVNIAHLLAEC